MMDFFEHMTFVCFTFVALGVVIGLPCYLFEKIDEKFDGKFSQKLVDFFTNENED